LENNLYLSCMTDKERIAQLEGQLSQALARIAELEKLLLKLGTKKDSQNSHLPPSSDIPRKRGSLRVKSGKPVGGQTGHEGHTLEFSATPDVVEEIRPDFCNACGSSLEGHEFALSASRQLIDIPPIKPITTEYRVFSTLCRCGHHQGGHFPDGVSNYVQYGPNIQSMAVYQSFYQFMPFARLQDFFAKVCRLPIGKGTIENILRRTAQKALPAYEKIRAVLIVSFFVGSDETSFSANGKKNWFWVWQNKVATYLLAATSRSKKVISDTFPEGLPDSVVCTDRLAAQLSTVSRGSQICLAHLLRDLNYLVETEKAPWASDFKSLLCTAIKLKQEKAEYAKDDKKALDIEDWADRLLNPAFLEGQMADKAMYRRTQTFFRGMVKLRQALFPFLYDHRIPFDNNGSERAIRNVKVKLKVSGQFKSLQQEYAIIRSVIDTAIKNGQSVFHAIYAVVGAPMPEKVAG
jgi:transposase